MCRNRGAWVALVGLLLCGCENTDLRARISGELFCCSGQEVFLIDVEEARRTPQERIWSWRATDSPEIASRHRGWFHGIVECKPALRGSVVLLSSSSAEGGAVALVRRSDKKCLFYAGGRNAHSAELIGTDLLAGAFSFGCDQLRLYRLRGKALAADPAWSMELRGAHGVVWDRGQQALWALGSDELLKLKVTPGPQPSAEVLKRWKLPLGGGHDLAPLDAGHLVVTVNSGVYRFDVNSGSFARMKGLGGKWFVKSVSRHPATGQIAYTQGKPTYARSVRFLGGEDLPLPVDMLYKVRWNAPNPLD